MHNTTTINRFPPKPHTSAQKLDGNTHQQPPNHVSTSGTVGCVESSCEGRPLFANKSHATICTTNILLFLIALLF